MSGGPSVRTRLAENRPPLHESKHRKHYKTGAHCTSRAAITVPFCRMQGSCSRSPGTTRVCLRRYWKYPKHGGPVLSARQTVPHARIKPLPEFCNPPINKIRDISNSVRNENGLCLGEAETIEKNVGAKGINPRNLGGGPPQAAFRAYFLCDNMRSLDIHRHVYHAPTCHLFSNGETTPCQQPAWQSNARRAAIHSINTQAQRVHCFTMFIQNAHHPFEDTRR